MPRKQSQDGFERCFGSCLWFPSYFAAGCGAAPLSLIKTYIENQEKPDQAKTRDFYPNLRDGTLRRNRVNHPKGVATALT